MVIADCDPRFTVIVKVTVVVVMELPSVTVILIPEKVPATVGVPLITLPLSVSPVGSVPVATVYTYPLPLPPVAAVSVSEYAVPAVAVRPVIGAEKTGRVMFELFVTEVEAKVAASFPAAS